MKKLILACWLCLGVRAAYAQQTEKTNPIIFADTYVGFAGGRAGGFAVGAGLNYQVNRHVFALRYGGAVGLGTGAILMGMMALPTIRVERESSEIAAMYGWRFIKDNRSLSFSLGASHNRHTFYPADDSPERKYVYLGLPFEVDLKIFKSNKDRFRILYGLVPIGKPTAFSRSIGFKFFGNVSRNSYAGLGITFGLGMHKTY
ncbi:hypothetical protein [Pontibacter vulgaris]|uniref:hypothetical protein n=1 Tax=Pontibacter vulgaris TaxID=2905679 RepID=UPI001FA6AE54|nr:hypothetical protein [Pontibacter vulgaris]